MLDVKKLRERLETLYDVYANIAGEDQVSLVIRPPAAEQEVARVERKIGLPLPHALRDFLLHFSGDCEFEARLPEDFELPGELGAIFAAELVLSPEAVYYAENVRREWIKGCFPHENDAYDRVWHHKLGFMQAGNGDVIALDIGANAENPPVVYLSHDEGEGHGCILGRTFEEYMENLILVGACGCEDWKMLPFCPDATSGIDPNCENAVQYRERIGLHW